MPTGVFNLGNILGSPISCKFYRLRNQISEISSNRPRFHSYFIEEWGLDPGLFYSKVHGVLS